MSGHILATHGEVLEHPTLEDLRAVERNHDRLASYLGDETDRAMVVAGRKPAGATVWTLYTQARDAWIRAAEARNPSEQRNRNREAREAEGKVLEACKAIGPADEVGGGQL